MSYLIHFLYFARLIVCGIALWLWILMLVLQTRSVFINVSMKRWMKSCMFNNKCYSIFSGFNLLFNQSIEWNVWKHEWSVTLVPRCPPHRWKQNLCVFCSFLSICQQSDSRTRAGRTDNVMSESTARSDQRKTESDGISETRAGQLWSSETLERGRARLRVVWVRLWAEDGFQNIHSAIIQGFVRANGDHKKTRHVLCVCSCQELFCGWDLITRQFESQFWVISFICQFFHKSSETCCKKRPRSLSLSR